MNLTESPIDTQHAGHFGIIDYIMFIATLSVSSLIGIYFGFFEKKASKSTAEYLMGGRQMQVFPIAMSLIASQLSATTVLGSPVEMYTFGTQYSLMAPNIIFVVLFINYIFIPVYYNNNITNCYKYLELRYNKRVHKFATAVFLLSSMLTLPVFMYLPALAFSQVIGLNIYLINGIVSCVCIIYTLLGGIKAVVWTDVFQAIVMLGSSTVVLISAVNKIGGLGKVWDIADKGNRLEFFNLSSDLTVRHTFINTILSYGIIWIVEVGLSQSCVQRVVSVPTMQKARRTLWLVFFGSFAIVSLNNLNGVVMYSTYASCDPVKAGVVENPSKLVPYFVDDVIGHLSGMQGLFFSGVFSFGLSTMSAKLNTLSAVFYYDYIRKMNIVKDTDENAKFVIKIVLVIIGVYSTAMGFIVDKFSFILQLQISIMGITHGATFGIFVLGVLWPYANSKGVLTGGIIALGTVTWIVVGAQMNILNGGAISKPLPVSLENCVAMGINVTKIFHNENNSIINSGMENESFSIYNIGFPWYTVIGSFISIVVGIIASFLMGGRDQSKLYSHLYPPIIQWLCPKGLLKEDTDLPEMDSFLKNKNLEGCD